MKGDNILKAKCKVCGKVTFPRVPKFGDGSLIYTRRHKIDGWPCAGNLEEAEWIKTAIQL